MANEQWVTLDDTKLRAVWQCPNCDNIITVSPDTYEQIGTPFCTDDECDCEMEYLRTEFNNG